MVDPVAVAVQYLRADAALASMVGERIAGKHHYGHYWPRGNPGIVLHLDGDVIDPYTGVHSARMEMRVYASDTVTAMSILRTLETILLAIDRAELNDTTYGNHALIYSALPDSGVSLLKDDALGMEIAQVFYEWRMQEVT